MKQTSKKEEGAPELYRHEPKLHIQSTVQMQQKLAGEWGLNDEGNDKTDRNKPDNNVVFIFLIDFAQKKYQKLRRKRSFPPTSPLVYAGHCEELSGVCSWKLEDFLHYFGVLNKLKGE